MCPELHSLIDSLLTKDPTKRVCDPEQIKKHPFFRDVDFSNLKAPFKPKLSSETDTSYFHKALRQVDPYHDQPINY